MSQLIEIHPENPQPRLVDQVVSLLRSGGVIALPTDSGYAIACTMANGDGLDRIRRIRQVDDKHHFTLLCHDFSQLGQLVIVDNKFFRLIKSLTPGPYTFILKGTKEVPKMTLNPKKSTVGVRIPDHKIAQAIIGALGEPLLSSTLILPGESDPITEGWVAHEAIGDDVDMVIDGPVPLDGPTSVINFSTGEAVIEREGAGDLSMFTEE